MAVIIITWDESTNKQNIDKSKTMAVGWRNTVLKQPGLLEFQAFRSFSDDGMVVERFSSSADAMNYLESEDYTKIVNEMRDLGITNIKAKLWSTAVDVPQPLTPASRS